MDLHGMEAGRSGRLRPASPLFSPQAPITPLPPSPALGRPRALALLLSLLLGAALATGTSADAASPLLESVKQNPALARSLCERFKQLNAQNKSATSPEGIASVAASQGLSTVDAEVLTTYVIGLHCPDVR